MVKWLGCGSEAEPPVRAWGCSRGGAPAWNTIVRGWGCHSGFECLPYAENLGFISSPIKKKVMSWGVGEKGMQTQLWEGCTHSLSHARKHHAGKPGACVTPGS